MRFWPAAAVDTLAVTAFAVTGRSSHGGLSDLAGTWQTAWPFLAGALLGTLAVRAWRAPATLRTGLGVWLGTLIAGMLLRWVTGGGIAVSFVIVAAVTLAVLLMGWRGAYALIRRARRPDLVGSRS